MNNDFWDKNLEEDVFEMTEENDAKISKRIIERYKPQHLRASPKQHEIGFEATFSYAYDNCKKRRIDGKKIIYVMTETVDEGKDSVRTKLFLNYPNLEINTIIHKED